MALGQGIGQGINVYKEKKKRRDHNASKALAIRGQFDEAEEAGTLSAADTKMYEKLKNLEDLGSKQIESLVAEYETGEEIKLNSMKSRLLEYQTEAAGAKVASMKGLSQFGQDMPGVEAGFEGDVPSNLPEYLTRDWAEGDRGQRDIAAGAFPGEHYGDESKAIYENVSTIPEGETRAAKHWMDKFKATGVSHGDPSPDNDELRSAAIARNDERMAELDKSIAGYDSRRDTETENYQKNFNEKAPWLARQIVGDAYKHKANEEGDLPWPIVEWGDQGEVGQRMMALESQNYKDKEELANLKVENEVLGMKGDSLKSEAEAKSPAVWDSEEPQYFESKLKGYETHGDDDTTLIDGIRYAGTSQQQPLDRMATGGRPDTPMDERRGQLIDSLAQYGLTPTDRKQAIEMISEKYPKLKEFATEIESPKGEGLGFTIGGTFIPARQGVGSAGVGSDKLELSSVTVNSKGEVTRILKPKEDLSDAQKTLLSNAKEFKHQAETLLKTVKSHGGWESAFSGAFSKSSAEARANLESLSYRMAILYSKIVDPATAAREGEVVAAKKYAFPMGFWVPNEVTKAAVNSMLEEVMRRESDFYEQEGRENPQAQEAGAATNPADELGIL
jgi:hypothetical protein